MTLYVDSSALLKRYVDEPDSDRAVELLSTDPTLVTGRHTVAEVRRNLARVLSPTDATVARAAFATDLTSFSIVELDANTCELAATIAEQTSVRTLDAPPPRRRAPARHAAHLRDLRRAPGPRGPIPRLRRRRRVKPGSLRP